MRDSLLLAPVFIALMVGVASTEALAQQASDVSSGTWQGDTNAFARLLLGEDLRPRPTASGKPEDVPIAASTLQQVIGSRVSWQMSLRKTPKEGLLIPVSVIVHEGQDTGFFFLALFRSAGGPDLGATQGFAADSQVVVSGKVDAIRARYRGDGKIIVRVNLREVDVKPRD